MCIWIGWRNVKERNRVENIDMDGRILLKWSLKNTIGKCGLD